MSRLEDAVAVRDVLIMSCGSAMSRAEIHASPTKEDCLASSLLTGPSGAPPHERGQPLYLTQNYAFCDILRAVALHPLLPAWTACISSRR